jgi:hypothetical protein
LIREVGPKETALAFDAMWELRSHVGPPVNGTLSVERDDEGEAQRFLLSCESR